VAEHYRRPIARGILIGDRTCTQLDLRHSPILIAAGAH
jgi:hypothetical protein